MQFAKLNKLTQPRKICLYLIDMAKKRENMTEEKILGTFEKYLAVWVAVCMIIGLVLSQTIPGLSQALNNWQIRGISIPIGICLFLMMYPALLNLQLEELRKLMRNPKPIFLTIFSNWVIAPLVTFF